ncbi:hypothetical protein H477_4458 [[Clostridium] sordellii ATCC 9714]|nr:hypothetical protein H477_4458 [[Clostridium] sordellii ATCC 9714] [Paeniclostridium sordellii ATCC 9714]
MFAFLFPKVPVVSILPTFTLLGSPILICELKKLSFEFGGLAQLLGPYNFLNLMN